MCVASAIIVGGAIAAGGTIASSAIQAKAAKNAANTQAEAADKAIAFQREQYQQARQDFTPYQQAGAGAVGRLTTAAGAPPPAFSPRTPPVQLGLPQAAPADPMGAGAISRAGLGVPGGPVAALGGPPVRPGGPAGGMVLMRAPDGSQRPVPAALVAPLEAKGARRVG